MKAKLYLSLILLLGTINTSLAFQEGQDHKILFEKAVYCMETKADLKEAITLFESLIKTYPSEKEYVAKSLLYQGMCYEKMGNQEAAKKYQRLVDNFPGQKNEVALAKERLSRLILIADNIPKVPLEPKFTKIKIPTKPGNGVLSPDGKKLAYVFEKSLWILPVHGKTNPDIAGEPVRITDLLSVWDLANMGIVWSSNGKWLAFNVSVTGEEKRNTDEIFIVPATGGNLLMVTLNQQRHDIRGYDYRMSLSSDGKILAFVNCDDNKKTIIYTISTKGGTPTKLTGSGTREPAFSPDGKLMAYVKVNPKNRLGNEVWVIPSTGGNPILVSDNADVVKSPIWSPDGSMIAFLARKYKKGWANNSNELWIAPVNKTGELGGVISSINLDNSTVSMLSGWSHDNKIGLWLSTPEKNVLYTVPASGGQALQVAPKDSWMPCWSPDGQYLYFDGQNTMDFSGLESIPFKGGNVARVPVSSEYVIQPSMPTGGISASPDGKKIVYAGFYSNINDTEIQNKLKGTHVFTIPAKGGEPVRLTTNPEDDRYPVWSPDGKSIAFIRVEPITENNISNAFLNIYTIPSNGGTPKKITSESDKVTNGRIDWTPDGKWIGYFSEDNTIKVIPSEGGDSKTLVNEVNPHSHFGLSFSPGGDKIVYSSKKKLIKVDINGKNEVEIKTGLDGVPTMPSWSPDGEKIAFCAFDEGETDLWLMENFLPLEKLATKSEIEAAKEPEGIAIRQVWTGMEADNCGSVSLDGKYLSFVDWETGDLAIRDLTKGTSRRLTNEASYEDPNQFAYSSVFSPDGKQVVYSWFNSDLTFDLRLLEIDNPVPRILYTNNNESVFPAFWLTDDNKLIARRYDSDNKSQIISINIPDGSVHVLKILESENQIRLSPSPDNKYLLSQIFMYMTYPKLIHLN